MLSLCRTRCVWSQARRRWVARRRWAHLRVRRGCLRQCQEDRRRWVARRRQELHRGCQGGRRRLEVTAHAERETVATRFPHAAAALFSHSANFLLAPLQVRRACRRDTAFSLHHSQQCRRPWAVCRHHQWAGCLLLPLAACLLHLPVAAPRLAACLLHFPVAAPRSAACLLHLPVAAPRSVACLLHLPVAAPRLAACRRRRATARLRRPECLALRCRGRRPALSLWAGLLKSAIQISGLHRHP